MENERIMTMARTINQSIEDLQKMYCECLDTGEEQEAYWIQETLQNLYEEQAREAGIEY